MSKDTPATWAKDPAVRLVLSTAPADQAQDLATDLVQAQAAACVNLIPGVRSIYRWQGSLANEPETLLLIKTTEAALPALYNRLTSAHTYEVPEVVAWALAGASAPYAAWVAENVPVPNETASGDDE